MPLYFNPPVIAHRGASAYAPENTMAAFLKAAELGIQWVEFDVMQAASGELIIFHDEQLERTSNGKGNVCDHPYPYLQTLDAGSWFDAAFANERIPTFMQVIEFLQSKNMFANIELKPVPGQEERFVKRMLQELQPYWSKENSQFLFSSFNPQALSVLRDHSATCQIGLLLHEYDPEWPVVCEALNCVSVHVNHEILSLELAQKIKNMDKMLLSYTINHPQEAKKLYALGVDAIFSDEPDKLILT